MGVYVVNTDVASALGWDSSDSELLADIDVALEFVEPAVDQYCETSFLSETGTSKFYNGSDTPMLTLGFFLRTLNYVYEWLPVYTETGIVMERVSLPYPDIQMQPTPSKDGTYRWLERIPMSPFDIHHQPNKFPRGLNNIEVNGNWGFDDGHGNTKVPSSVKWAIIHGVKHFFDMRDFDSTVRQQTGIGHSKANVKLEEIDYLPPISRMLLTRYQNTRKWSE